MARRSVAPGRYAAASVAAAAIVLAAYANHFRNDFHFDDSHTIQNNLYIHDLQNIPLFFTSTRTFSSLPANQSYRPLLATTLAIDYALGGGLNPVAFHVTSFTLFAIQCVVMLLLFRRVFDLARPDAANRWTALFAAAWYGVHAANAETVNYIIARSEILSTLGVVAALLMFAAGGPLRRYGLYLIPAAAGMFSKEQAVMFAPLLFVYVALCERQRGLGELWRPREIAATLGATWPAFAVCGAIAILGQRLAVNYTPGGSSRWQYLLAQPFAILHYAISFFLPLNLSADTDWTPIANPFDDRVIAGLVFIVAALTLAWIASRRRETRPIAFGILWFFLALLPTSSLVPLAEVMNDHRMYFPFVGLTMAVAWGVAVWARGRPWSAPWADWRRGRPWSARGADWRRGRPWSAPWADWRRGRPWSARGAEQAPPLHPAISPLYPAISVVAIVALLAMAYGTHRRNQVWRTEESLWLDVTRKSPANGRGLMTYGVIQMGKGNYVEAERYFDQALKYTPKYAYLHVNIGVLKGALGQPVEAERHFREAQQYDPRNPVSYFYYGRWLDSVGRRDEALDELRHAVELSPGHVDAQNLLREIQTRRTAPAVTTAASETAEQWLALSLAQFQAGRYQDCVDSSLRALKLRPDYAEAFNNLCAADNALGRYQDAIDACERALSLKPDFPLARNNLADARAKLGR